MYLSFGHVFLPKKLRAGMERTNVLMRKSLRQEKEVMDRLETGNPGVANQSKYILDYAGMPVWEQTSAAYYPEGIIYWKNLLEDLEHAERFVFLEFFILCEGAMWNAVLDVLERKV